MSSNRKIWSEEEDELLKQLFEEFGVTKWGFIAKTIETRLENINRTGKQCRERWHNHLNPEINRQEWTENEKNKILELHIIYGNRWSKIAQHLEGRSDNAVKNFYYSNLRKNIRKNARNKAIRKRKNRREKKEILNEGQGEIKVLYDDEKKIEEDSCKIIVRMDEKEENVGGGNGEEVGNVMEKIETVNTDCGGKVAFFPSYGNFYMLSLVYSQQLMQYQLNQAMLLANCNQRNDSFL
ncbi:hypothetical protein SteCoe_1242 [Stentor coeruleus]|uniref:Uncharacterized protein n=1 Tax=Stentor coeruleus TaxID=5963 RepID=A0A1R2D2A7_9CILI|nr:hypothetical protein SteCoe_1242 [Stentor coeruleus]